MENPFKVKGIASDEHFFNRLEEIKTLITRARDGEHLFIIAPRRLGKTSLIKHVFNLLNQNNTMHTAYVDLFLCAGTSDMVRMITKQVLKSTKLTPEKLMLNVRKLLPGLAPKLTFTASGEPEFSMNLLEKSLKIEDLVEVLEWFDTFGPGKKLIALDEFQEIIQFENSVSIEKKLRAIVQTLKNTTFFYSGSQPSLLREMFTQRNRAFYQSAMSFELGFASANHAKEYLHRRMVRLKPPTGVIDTIQDLAQGHPYYTQLLGYLTVEIFNQTNSWAVFNQEHLLASVFQFERTTFESSIAALTLQQRVLYRAIARQPLAAITSSQFLQNHNLGAHSTVRKSAKKLELLGYIIKTKDGYFASDPLLAKWWGQ